MIKLNTRHPSLDIFEIMSKLFIIITLYFSVISSAVSASAKELWEQSKSREGYNQYASEFAQFNNHFKLDTKNGCYKLSPETVTLFLIITSKGKIESVETISNNEKALCFIKTYKSLL